MGTYLDILARPLGQPGTTLNAMPSTVRRLFRTGSTSQIGKICFGGALSLSAPAPATGMRVLDSYGMVYLESGRGTYTDTLGTCSALVAGDVVLLFPD